MRHSLAALLGLVLVCLTGSSRASNSADKFVLGQTAELAGGTLATWARVNGGGKVIWVGATFSLAIAENQPSKSGAGPSRASAVLNFPEVVQAATYFNHFELHSEPEGHHTDPRYLTPNRNSAPHFDFHFYSIPVDQVWAIPAAALPLPDVPPERLPVDYVQPQASAPQMGRHSQPLSEYTAVGPLDATMIAGFLPDASYMHFIEPMISRVVLLSRENFTLPVPRPVRLGRPTSYPTECVLHYDRDADAYHIIFKGFEPIE